MSKHTPGPWEINYDDLDENCISVRRGNDKRYIVCTIPAFDDDASEADGYLIAAAPRLLKALKALADCAQRSLDGEATVSAVEDVISAARAAIAQAEGRGT